MRHFPRLKLAQDTADAMQGKSLFGDAPNGLFLAAPRRTGKSTFLQSDLAPELERRDIAVVYVDLWADQTRDPGSLIAEAIGKIIATHQGWVAKAAKATHLDSITIAGVLKMDTSKIGRPDGATLTEALSMLADISKKPVALIVDEAQHALTSVSGETAMTALKAARDTINSPGQARLMLVMSGSDRDKLLRLVNTNGAPFYGSTVQRMPELGKDFIDFVGGLIEANSPQLKPVDSVKLLQAFQRFGSRPQFFSTALADALSPLSSGEGRFEDQLLEAASRRQVEDEAQMESEFLALRPIEQAVLWRLLEQGSRFRPYDAEALKFYRDKLNVPSQPPVKVTAQTAQNAVEAIRQRTPALVWKSARGEYSVDDAMMHTWYANRVAAGTWPPKGFEPDDLIAEAPAAS
jgi:hypothetical protein